MSRKGRENRKRTGTVLILGLFVIAATSSSLLISGSLWQDFLLNLKHQLVQSVEATQSWFRAERSQEAKELTGGREGRSASKALHRSRRSVRRSVEKIQVGKTYRAVVADVMEREGVVRLGGQEIRIVGAHLGDEITFLVTDDLGTHAVGYLLSRKKPSEQPERTDRVRVDQTFHVVTTISFDFSTNAVALAWIDGLPVVVQGIQPGAEVTIRIVKRHPSWAVAVVVDGQ